VRAPASVDSELQLLSRIFALAIERNLVVTNPCKGVKPCGLPNLVPRFLTDENEERLLPF
jgi:site-specific recombinase XerC